jgi:mobilome CxxCx(11)CxxC protein
VVTESQRYDAIRLNCHERAFTCFGSSYIFQKRGAWYKFLLNTIQAFGILIPLFVGTVVLSYGIGGDILPYLIIGAVGLSTLQFLFSALAFLLKWDQELSYAYEAKASYDNLYRKYKKLGSAPPDTLVSLEKEYDLLELEISFRNNQDTLHEIKEWELRRGMKWSLREYKEQCVGCKITPISKESTDCPVCGNYSIKYKIFNL